MNKKTAKKTDAKKRILIVDDHPMMRQGLSQLIANELDLEVCCEAATAAEGLAALMKSKPDLVIADISLPDKNGLELIKDMRAVAPEALILIISMHDESLYAERTLKAGARGYVMKQEGGARLLEAMRQVLAGQISVSPGMSAKILELFSGGKASRPAGSVAGLSDRELEVFELIGGGRSTKEIAGILNLSAKTVEVHRLNIKGKLGLTSATELIRQAVRWVESSGGG